MIAESPNLPRHEGAYGETGIAFSFSHRLLIDTLGKLFWLMLRHGLLLFTVSFSTLLQNYSTDQATAKYNGHRADRLRNAHHGS